MTLLLKLQLSTCIFVCVVFFGSAISNDAAGAKIDVNSAFDAEADPMPDVLLEGMMRKRRREAVTTNVEADGSVAQVPATRAADAKSAESEMMDAAAEEQKGSAYAQASASNMVHAIKKKAASIVSNAQGQINAAFENASSEMTEEKSRLDKKVRDLQKTTASAMDEVVDHASKASEQASRASANTEITAAVGASDAAAKLALTKSSEVKADIWVLEDAAAASGKRVKAIADRAAEHMESIARQAQSDVTLMGEQLVTVGLKASAQMKAREDATGISSKTGTAADDLKNMIKDFSVLAKQTQQNTKSRADFMATDLAESVSAAKTVGFSRVKQLTDAAEATEEAMTSAKREMMASDRQAVNKLSDAAGPTDGKAGSMTYTTVLLSVLAVSAAILALGAFLVYMYDKHKAADIPDDQQ